MCKIILLKSVSDANITKPLLTKEILNKAYHRSSLTTFNELKVCFRKLFLVFECDRKCIWIRCSFQTNFSVLFDNFNFNVWSSFIA